MTDFDEEHRIFSYDDEQPRKLPSWTYRSAPPPPRATPPAAASPRPMSVLLDHDVVAGLRALDADGDQDVHEQANAALRAWLAERAKRG